MPVEHKIKISRRDFFKIAGAAGIGSMLSPLAPAAAAAEQAMVVPTRPFGKTGVNVSILSVGGTMDLSSSQLMLRQAVKWGVTYWDTANSYGWGRSEEGIGKYLAKFPEDRRKLFLVTKSEKTPARGLRDEFHASLERMQTDYVDLFLMHGLGSLRRLNQDTKAWVQKAKSEGKIRFFGFSTHSNMEVCLLEAAKLGWIDGIMMAYNYRLMNTDEMRRAVDACEKAGIGLTAMKTQGGGQVATDSDSELQLAGRFLQKGFSDAQAKLKAVWENPQIACICSRMPNMSILMSNVAAALERTRLSLEDKRLLRQHAAESAAGYCAGCTNICEAAMGDQIPIGQVMRCLMYARSYDDRDGAVAEFEKLPADLRRRMGHLDYAAAEQRCPQKMAIARLMREALQELS